MLDVRLRRIRRAAGATVAGLMLTAALTSGVMAGNNGTLKVHETGSPIGTEDTEPHVGCSFDIEAFGLDAGQTGFLVFSSQGGDGPIYADIGPIPFGPADGSGYAILGSFRLLTGHYDVTLYGKDGVTELKAKSKVFHVTCDDGGGGGGGG
jgi:hypothetical protein